MNRKEFKNIIDTYLEATYSPYAIMINGGWGSGKTYYFKEIFDKKYKRQSIYVSVNGLKSVNELAKSILVKNYWKNKPGVFGKLFNLGKTVVKGAVNHYTDGALDSTEVVEQALEFFEMRKDQVVIIDDLERISDELKIEDLLGFISRTLLEKKNSKVILISNQQKLINRFKDSDYSYLQMKEKVIWKSLDFKPDYRETTQSIIKKFPTLCNLFEQKEDLILQYVNDIKLENFRTIIFFFQTLESIIAKLDKNCVSESFIDRLLYSILVLCNEYKEGNLEEQYLIDKANYVKRETPGMDGVNILMEFENPITKTNEIPKNNKEESLMIDELLPFEYFSKRYLHPFEKRKYKYLPSVLNYVLKGILDYDKLIRDISTLKSEVEVVLPEMELLREFNSLSKIEDSDLSTKWENLKSYISNGEYGFETLIELGHYYLAFQIILPDTIDSFFSLLSQAVEISEEDKINQDILDHQYIGITLRNNKTDLNRVEKLKDIINKRRFYLYEKANSKKINAFLEKINSKERYTFQELSNFFNHANAKQVVELVSFISSSSKNISHFSQKLYDGRREVGLVARVDTGKTNIKNFLSTLEQRIKPESTKFISLKQIQNTVRKFILLTRK